MRQDPPIDPERWRRIEAALDQALELPPEARRAVLEEACAGDPGLRAEVEELLAADERAGGFLGTPASEYAAALLPSRSGSDAELPAKARRLGPYLLLREIGSGGMGVVYEAEDTRLGRRVAVKLLPPEYGRDRRATERFLREARAASALDHPNICTVHDVGESDGVLYLVMAHYEGETLRARLERGPLPVAEARALAIAIARALVRAHEAGITHRDLKPANVMLTRRGEVKLLDFGIAKLGGEASLTLTAGSLGTPAYMAPEQARGVTVDGRADLWSLGVILYEALAGVRPFRGDDVQALLYAVLSHQPEPLDRLRPEVPPALARTVARALSKDPADRHQHAAELLAELESGTAPAVAPAARPARRPRLRKSRVLAAAALALATLAALWLLRPFRAGPPLRVAVLRPTVTGDDANPDAASAAAEVMGAAIGTLASLGGLQPLDEPPRDEASGSRAEALRAAEANEVVRPLLDCRTESCGVTLRRLASPAGAVLAAVGPFEIPTGVDRSQRLAEAVRVHLLRLYPRHRPRPEAPGGRVNPEDYAAFAELERRNDRGEPLGEAALRRLDELLRTSPDFFGASLLGAEIARTLPDPERATDYADRAHRLAPHDPRPLFSRFRIALAGHHLDQAAATLAQLADLAPGDVRVQTSEAELLEARGELREARRLREEIVRRRPTWREILALATLEIRLGAGESALSRLRELLAEQPDNAYLLERVAFFEVELGDLRRAEDLYERLSRMAPGAAYLSSLGWVRYLAGDYGAAEAAYRRSLDLEPGRLLTRFNHAAALAAQGRRRASGEAFAALARDFEAAAGRLDARERLLWAQCLARLGERAAAARLAEEVLARTPEDLQVLQGAAQLHALLGERLSALFYAERCLKGGLRREWLTIPEFASLAGDPEFQALLASRPTGRLPPASGGSDPSPGGMRTH